MPRGDISCEARKGEGGSLSRTNYITGTCLKVFLHLVSSRLCFFLLYKMPSLPFQRQRIENEGPTFRFKNKDGLNRKWPQTQFREDQVFRIPSTPTRLQYFYIKCFMHHCVFLLYF